MAYLPHQGLTMRTPSMFFALPIFLLALPAQAADLTGNWSGCWVDTRSGHTGPLHATFCSCDDDHYRVTFTGRFFKIFPFRYQVVLRVTSRDGDRVFLTGQQNLGPLVGTFTYTAEASATNFMAHFCSRRYEGDFILKKCCP